MPTYPAGSQVPDGYYVFKQGYTPNAYELSILNSVQGSRFSNSNIPPATPCKVTNLDSTGIAIILYDFEMAGVTYRLETKGPVVSMPLKKILFQTLSPNQQAPFIKMVSDAVLYEASLAGAAESAAKTELTPAYEALQDAREAATASDAATASEQARLAVKKVGDAIHTIVLCANEVSHHASIAAKAAANASTAMQDPAADASASVGLIRAMNSANAAAAVVRTIENMHTEALNYMAVAESNLVKARIANAYRRTAGNESKQIADAVRAGRKAGPPIKNWSGGKSMKCRRNYRNKSRKQRINSKFC